MKEESEKASQKLNMKKKKRAKFMASSPIISWQIEREKVDVVTNFIFLGSKVTVQWLQPWSLKLLAPWKETMTNLDSMLKSRDIILPTKICLVKAMVFPVSHVWMWELDHKEGWAPKN